MRTTLTLEADAFQAAKAKAAHEGISLGKAVSALILQGLRLAPTPPGRGDRSPAVFRSAGGIYRSDDVEASMDDE